MSTINYTYNVIVDRFRQFAAGHFQLRRFTHGEISQADLEKEAEWPWLHVKPRAINYSPGTRSFQFEIFISDLPRDKEDKTGYQAESITDCSLIFQDLINEIYLGNMFGSDVVLTRPVNSEPFVEQYTHTLTGVTGTIELQLDYDWSACSIPASWNYNTPTDSESEANNYLSFVDSLIQQGYNVSLLNDEEAPGNSYYYGTDENGVKGWHEIVDNIGLTCETLPDCATIISILDDIAALQADVALKANTADLGATAFSNDYNDLDNKPTIPAAQIQSDWTQSNNTALDFIKNKPTIPAAQVNSDWNATSGVAEILNKPTIPSISGLATVTYVDQQDALKVDKVAGKGLSTEDYTTAEKNKLAGIQAGAEVNVNADWNATSGDAQILNKPTIPSQYNPTAGTGISISGTYPNQTIANTAPDQVVALTAGTGIGVSGTYPNFTITNTSSGGGTVTSVTGTAPIASTGGATPDISISQASASTDGYLSSTDFNTFNGKQAALISGTNIKTINSTSLLGSGNVAVEPTITAGTTSQYYRGDKTFQTLDKSAVGLSNVDNTSDANKPISTATQTALNAKQNTLTLTTTGTSGAATLVGSTLNIPQYSGGGGSFGIHALVPLASGDQVAATLQSSTSGSGGSYSANRLVAYPFIPKQSFTSSNLQINVTVIGAGALCRIAVYTDLNGTPDTSLFISSNLDCSTTGLKTATASINFVAGTTYWMALHGGTTASINQILVSQMFPIKYSNINTSANHLWRSLNFSTPTPTTFGGGNTYAAGNMPLIIITKA